MNQLTGKDSCYKVQDDRVSFPISKWWCRQWLLDDRWCDGVAAEFRIDWFSCCCGYHLSCQVFVKQTVILRNDIIVGL